MHFPDIYALFAKLQARWELRRLEERYVRRSNRNTFTSGATYVDGEYVTNATTTPIGTGSSKLSKQSLASLKSTSTDSKQKSKGWGYNGPMPSVGNWSR